VKNFTQRAITGLSFAFVMTAAILWGPLSFIAIFFLISTLGIIEFYGLVKSDQIQPQMVAGVIISQSLLILFTALTWYQSSMEWMLIALPLLSLIFILELFRNKKYHFRILQLHWQELFT